MICWNNDFIVKDGTVKELNLSGRCSILKVQANYLGSDFSFSVKGKLHNDLEYSVLTGVCDTDLKATSEIADKKSYNFDVTGMQSITIQTNSNLESVIVFATAFTE